MKILLAALLAAAGSAHGAPAESTGTAKAAIDASTSALLQGDANRALAAMAVPAAEFSAKDADYRACLFGRFERTSPPYLPDDLPERDLRELLTAYRTYWWQALKTPAQREALDAQLLARLRTLLGPDAPAEWDAVEEAITQRVVAHGYHAQLGRTPPLREFMLWRKQTSLPFDVKLPETTYAVHVEMLDDFVSLGWSHYARCGRGSAGGWATTDRLYAVKPWFGDIHSDQFLASLLGHETQHFADLTQYKDLKAWELEYRAKLTELWTARETLPKLLAKFAAAQSDDMESPHTYANKRVLAHLAERLRGEGVAVNKADLTDVPADTLRRAAQEQLAADSKGRQPQVAPAANP